MIGPPPISPLFPYTPLFRSAHTAVPPPPSSPSEQRMRIAPATAATIKAVVHPAGPDPGHPEPADPHPAGPDPAGLRPGHPAPPAPDPADPGPAGPSPPGSGAAMVSVPPGSCPPMSSRNGGLVARVEEEKADIP